MVNGNKNRKNQTIKQKPAKAKNPEAQRVSRLITATVLIAIAIVIILGLAGAAGPLGKYLALGLKFILAWSSWSVPIALLIIAYNLIILREEEKIRKTVWVGVILFAIALAGILHFYFLHDQTALKQQRGGGYLGFALIWSMNQVFGFWPSLIILIAIFLTSLFLIATLFAHTKKLIEEAEEEPEEAITSTEKSWLQKLKDKQQDKKEEKEKRDAEKAAEKAALIESMANEEEAKAAVRDAFKPIFRSRQIAQKTDLPLDLLEKNSAKPTSGDIKSNKLIIQKTLENFGISVEMGDVKVGPTVTQYTLRPYDGVKISQITSLNNDLALALAAHPIRIEAPIPGKALVGIEVPNQGIAIVKIREMLETEEFKNRKNNTAIAIGKDVAGHILFSDLTKMPHMLVAGATGSGKTVMLNSIIISLLYENSPDDLKFIFVDPKRVELSLYNDLPHLLTPVITSVPKTVNALKWAIAEMEHRFDVMSEARKRDIQSYNQDAEEKMPYIVIVVDELADLMVVAPQEIETGIIRLAQMARATGIHLVLATQRPSVDVITGLIKANITSRIAFSVASMTDSRTILDFAGAEKLLGRGDMLYVSADLSKPRRLQGAYVSDKEIKRVVDYLRNIREPNYQAEIVEKSSSIEGFGSGDLAEDELLPQAREEVIRAKRASASLLQRRLRVGYARAARLLDLLEMEGTIGPADGSKPREILKNILAPEGLAVKGEREGEEMPQEEEKQ
ncbi:MAG: DNA translocase FtsK 4TM domain-containing protein [Patescibacteria group bacterium]|nr:DNA translocase FtsK 4TM domain-containing protein [Patescibacteria group bacterium]MDD5121275.1 DNA translocase FtsK 4TM domain-containing protein [Patescibacteria group bacterium]MDD5395806.1 DNA translocase FtsK 4TM domain-containing protein [Patescibacteria group bacterium]